MEAGQGDGGDVGVGGDHRGRGQPVQQVLSFSLGGCNKSFIRKGDNGPNYIYHL